MSDDPISERRLDTDRPSKPLGSAIEDARKSAPPELDWDRMEARLFDRIDAENEKKKVIRPMRFLAVGAVALAAAAATVLWLGHTKDTTQTQPVSRGPMPAGAIISIADGSEVKVAGNVVSKGHAIIAGDAIDVTGESATFELEHSVVWAIEGGSHVTMSRDSGPLIVGLDRGAAEAQVVPVPAGQESFAVDVQSVRIAVHGTHLRVARTGDHVVVDLTEGMVAVGHAPQQGLTTGTIIAAPAHIELDTTNLEGSLTVDRGPASVRPAMLLVAASIPVMPQPTATVAQQRETPKPQAFVPHVASTHTQPDVPTPQTNAPQTLTTEAAIADAINTCVASTPSAAGVTMTVDATLTLRVGEDGLVQSARFSPPLLPDAQDCASRVIYKKTRLDHGGNISIPIHVKR